MYIFIASVTPQFTGSSIPRWPLICGAFDSPITLNVTATIAINIFFLSPAISCAATSMSLSGQYHISKSEVNELFNESAEFHSRMLIFPLLMHSGSLFTDRLNCVSRHRELIHSIPFSKHVRHKLSTLPLSANGRTKASMERCRSASKSWPAPLHRPWTNDYYISFYYFPQERCLSESRSTVHIFFFIARESTCSHSHSHFSLLLSCV